MPAVEELMTKESRRELPRMRNKSDDIKKLGYTSNDTNATDWFETK